MASTQVRDGRYVKVVPLAEVEGSPTSAPVCTWQGEPFIVLAQHDSWLRVEYTGGKAPVARSLGLEELDFGVYQGWAPVSEVRDLHEFYV